MGTVIDWHVPWELLAWDKRHREERSVEGGRGDVVFD